MDINNNNNEYDIKKLLSERPDKITYYIALAYLVAQASFDPSSKCGCIIVSKDNRILSTGYNGPLKHSKDDEIPLSRPEKYYHFLHAEENALLAYNGSFHDINGATAYVTGRPCHKCLRMLIQRGITNIVYGLNHTHVVDEADYKAQLLMLKHHPEVKVTEINDVKNIQKLILKTNEYIEKKKDFKPKY